MDSRDLGEAEVHDNNEEPRGIGWAVNPFVECDTLWNQGCWSMDIVD
jgi:hypothetical protein